MNSENQNPNWESLLVQYGLGAFETMRCVDGKIALLPYHIERISRVAFDWGIEKSEIEKAFTKALVNLPLELSRVKLLLGLNEGNELLSHLYVYPLKIETKGRKLLLRKCQNKKSENYKSCNYASHYLEKKKANISGYDDVCYEYDGQLLECSSSALVFLNKTEGIVAEGENLRSVSVSKLLDKKNSFWKKGKISLDTLMTSGALCVSNALHGLVPVESIHDERGEGVYESTCSIDLKKWNNFIFNE